MMMVVSQYGNQGTWSDTYDLTAACRGDFRGSGGRLLFVVLLTAGWSDTSGEVMDTKEALTGSGVERNKKKLQHQALREQKDLQQSEELDYAASGSGYTH